MTDNENHPDRRTERLDMLERMSTANPKDLPAINATYQKLINEQARRDMGDDK